MICCTVNQHFFFYRNTSRSDFVFTADRLIRLVIEEGLNILPCSPRTVMTSSGLNYEGLQFDKGNCGVSIIRSGMFHCNAPLNLIKD